MNPNFDPKVINGKWQHLVEWCLELYEKFSGSEYRKKKLDEIKDSVAAYNQEEEPTTDPWEGAHNLCLPLTTISADNLEPRLVAGLVGKRPYARFDTDADPEPAEVTEIEQWFDDELDQVVRIVPVTQTSIHRLLQDGTIWIEACYDYDERIRKDFLVQGEEPPEIQQAMQAHAMAMQQHQAAMQMYAQDMAIRQSLPPPTDIEGNILEPEEIPPPMPPEPPPELEILMGSTVVGGVYVGPDGNPITHDVVDKTFEGVRVKQLPFDDVFWDDLIPDGGYETAPLIKRHYTTYGELQRSKDKPGYIKKAIGLHLIPSAKEDAEAEGAQEETDHIRTYSKAVIELIDCYVSYTRRKEDQKEEDIKDWTEERYVVTIAVQTRIMVRRRLLRDLIYSNRHPIRRIALFAESNKMCGTSIYGKMKSIQEMANQVFNLSLNTAEIVLVPWFFYGQASGWTGGKKELKPGEGVPVDSTKDILFPQFPMNPQHFFSYLEFIIAFWERLFNVGDLQIGRETDKSKTATEALAVIQEGNISHNYRAGTIKEPFIQLIEVIYDLYYQNLPLDYVWTRGQKQMPIQRSMMRRARNFRLLGSTEMANSLIERREAEDRWVKVQEGHALGIANVVEGFKDMMQQSGVEDPERFINPAISQIVKIIQEQPQMANVMIMAAQQAAQQMAMAQAAQAEMAKGKPPGGAPNGPQRVPANGRVQGVPPQAGGANSGGFARPADVGRLAP